MKPHYSNTNNPIDFPKSKNKMNERIKQLALQADWDDEFLEKFAELIVRECALVIQKKVGPKSALDVLEHFGVEE